MVRLLPHIDTYDAQQRAGDLSFLSTELLQYSSWSVTDGTWQQHTPRTQCTPVQPTMMKLRTGPPPPPPPARQPYGTGRHSARGGGRFPRRANRRTKRHGTCPNAAVPCSLWPVPWRSPLTARHAAPASAPRSPGTHHAPHAVVLAAPYAVRVLRGLHLLVRHRHRLLTPGQLGARLVELRGPGGNRVRADNGQQCDTVVDRSVNMLLGGNKVLVTRMKRGGAGGDWRGEMQEQQRQVSTTMQRGGQQWIRR